MQRILWRNDANDPIKIFRLTTVTYGTGPASFIVTKCFQVLAESIRSETPDAAYAIESECYMDDLLTGTFSIDEAVKKQNKIHQTLQSAFMNLGSSMLQTHLNFCQKFKIIWHLLYATLSFFMIKLFLF